MTKPHAKTADSLRSARWFAPDDMRSMGHRSRFMQMGYGPEDWVGNIDARRRSTPPGSDQLLSHRLQQTSRLGVEVRISRGQIGRLGLR